MKHLYNFKRISYQIQAITLILCPLLILLLLTTCKDDAVSSNELGSVAGIWKLTLTVDSNTCGQPNGETNIDEDFIYFSVLIKYSDKNNPIVF